MPGFIITGGPQRNPGPSAISESARAHRWRITFDAIREMQDVSLYAKTCQRPSVEIDTIEIHNKQTQIRTPGKYRWLPITIEFYEMLEDIKPTGGTAGNIFKYWATGEKAVVNYDTNTIGRSPKTNAILYMLDGGGFETYTYEIFHMWPTKIEPSELNYAASDIATIKVTFNYDSAYEYAVNALVH